MTWKQSNPLQRARDSVTVFKCERHGGADQVQATATKRRESHQCWPWRPDKLAESRGSHEVQRAEVEMGFTVSRDHLPPATQRVTVLSRLRRFVAVQFTPTGADSDGAIHWLFCEA